MQDQRIFAIRDLGGSGRDHDRSTACSQCRQGEIGVLHLCVGVLIDQPAVKAADQASISGRDGDSNIIGLLSYGLDLDLRKTCGRVKRKLVDKLRGCIPLIILGQDEGRIITAA